MAVFDSGTDYDFFLHEREAPIQRSSFDLSRLNTITMDEGVLVPVDWFVTNPGEDFEISFEDILETLPLAVQPMERHRLMIEAFYVKNRDLWKGWKTMITRGRSGNVSVSVPTIDLDADVYSDEDYVASKPCRYHGSHSLASYLGVPGSGVLKDAYYKQSVSSDSGSSLLSGYNHPRYVNVLPFMAYQSIFKHQYLNQNYTQNNKAWFPVEGDDDWIIDYSGSNLKNGHILDVNNLDFDSLSAGADYVTSEVPRALFDPSASGVKYDLPSLLQLRYRQRRADYFYSALPWLQRGDAPELNGAVNSQFQLSFDEFSMRNLDLSMTNDTSGSEHPYWQIYTGPNPDNTRSLRVGPGVWTSAPSMGGTGDARHAAANSNINWYFQSQGVAPAHSFHLASSNASGVINGAFSQLNLGINLNQLRTLMALTVWQERNARTNGSYNRMIRVHHRQDPHSEEHLPVYIGGSSQDIYFNQVIQTSASNETPLGTTASNGVSQSRGFIGRFHSPDYGIVMILASVVPDNMYVQGVDKALLKSTFSDYYYPEFASLQPQAIQNQEIFVSGDEAKDKALFGYQERDTEYKVRQNRVAGMFALPPSTDSLFSAYTQAQIFSETPSLSNQFVTLSPDNVRRDWLAYPINPMFKFQYASRVRAIRNIPYQSVPQTFGF